MLLVSVRSWGSHTASCVHAHCLVLLLGKERNCLLPRASDGMLMWGEAECCTCSVDPGVSLPFDCLSVTYLCLLCSEEIISDPEFRSRVWHVLPLACSYNLHSYIWEGELHWILTDKENTVFQGLWKSLRSTLQLSFLVSSLFIYFLISRESWSWFSE